MFRIELKKLIIKYSNKVGLKNYLRSIVYFFGDFLSENTLAKNKYLENIHQGKRCFIMTTGLSVNNIEFSLLYNEYSFGGNFIFKHHDFHKLNLNHFVLPGHLLHIRDLGLRSVYVNPYIYSEDFIFPWLQPEKPTTCYSLIPEVFFREIEVSLNNDALVFLNSSSKKFIEKNTIFSNNKVYFLKPHGRLSSDTQQKIDLSNRITFEGLFYVMICIAMYVGFKEIYLIGNDYTFQPAQQFHFFDSPVFSKKLPKDAAWKLMYKIAKARDVEVYKIKEDEEFYRPIYVQYNKIPEQHVLIKEFAESIGVKMYNIVPEGFDSPIYEKITWDEVVKKLN